MALLDKAHRFYLAQSQTVGLFLPLLRLTCRTLRCTLRSCKKQEKIRNPIANTVQLRSKYHMFNLHGQVAEESAVANSFSWKGLHGTAASAFDTAVPRYPGSQLLAKLVLSCPELVAGKRVLEIGAGYHGIPAMAAVISQARAVVATDVDPVALHQLRLNLADVLNGHIADAWDRDNQTDKMAIMAKFVDKSL